VNKNLIFRTAALDAARARENWLFAHIPDGGMVSNRREPVNRRLLPMFSPGV
jgi:hypothetical protein